MSLINNKLAASLFIMFFSYVYAFGFFQDTHISVLNPDPYSQAAGASIMSLSPSVFGFFVNPASNYKNISKELQISYMSAYNNIYGANAGFVIPTEKNGNFSVMFSGVEYNKDIGSLHFKNSLMAAINYVYPLVNKYPIHTEEGSVGATFKFYNLKIKEDDTSTNLFSVDLGFIYELDFIDRNLTAALAVKNIGNDIEIKDFSQKQNQNFTASARYLLSDEYKVSVMADMVKNFEITDTGFAGGLETKPFYPFSVRVGWRDYRDNFNKGVTAGFSFDFNRVNVAYAYSDFLGTDDDQHIFSLGVYFGKIPDSGKAYDHYLGYYLNVAKDSYEEKNFILARNQFEEILAIYPNDPVAKHYLQLLSEDLDQTDRDFSQKVEKYLARADAAMLRNNLVRAKKYYNKALLLDNTNSQAIAGIAKVESEMAEQAIYANRKKYQKEISGYWVKAMNHFDNGEFVFAKEELLKITEIDPTNAGALQYLDFIQKKVNKVNAVQSHNIFKQGLAEFDKQNYEKALSYFNAAYISNPERDDIKEYIDKCNEQINAVKQSNLKTSSKNKLNLTNKQVEEQMKRVYNTGLEQFNVKDYKGALKTFNTLKAMSEQNKFFNYNEQIKTYVQKSNQAISKELYTQAKDLELREELSNAYAKYKEAVKYDPDNKKATKEVDKLNSVIAQRYYDQGLQSFAAGDREKAVSLLEKSLEYDPDKLEAQKALERIKE